jgi:hypothetical protein
MPRHSPRPTAGRKKRLQPHERDVTPPAPVKIPTGLSKAQRVAWRRLAPAAERVGTLTAETVEGFRLLVEVVVQRDEAWAIIARDGLVVFEGKAAHPLATHARQLGQRVESLMSRFALVAPGRAVERPRGEDDENPWAAIDRGAATGTSGFDFYGDANRGPRRVK